MAAIPSNTTGRMPASSQSETGTESEASGVFEDREKSSRCHTGRMNRWPLLWLGIFYITLNTSQIDWKALVWTSQAAKMRTP